MRKVLVTVITVLLFVLSNLPIVSLGQCSLPVQPRKNTVNVFCNQTCANISVRVQDLRQTTDYYFKDLPYYNYPFDALGSTELSILYSDDKFSNAISLPFDFCFFGQSMSSCVVGSNAILTFDFANASPCNNAWKLQTSSGAAQPIPFMGTQTCSNSTGPKYPGMSIMLPYYDIDPSASTTRKISYITYGVAPCRRFVVSFNKIPLFGNTPRLYTGQAVLHEGTGIIDINIENKPWDDDGSAWNGGFAILGLQKDASTVITNDSVNCKIFTLANKSYRFWPKGGATLLDSVQLIRNGNVIGLASIGAQSGEDIEISYPSYCPTGNIDTLFVKSFFRTCNQSGESITNTDTLIVSRNAGNLGATATTTSATCASPNGSITINIPVGAGVTPYQYSLNGGPYQLSNSFPGLPAGTYTVDVKDAGVCQQSLIVTVPSVTGITGNAQATATSCPGLNNGTIRITPTSGTGPYQYSLNGGAYQLSNTFSGLAPGTYNLSFKDANGCIGTTSATVVAGSSLQSTITPTHPPCAGVNNGSITITPSSGTAPYQYSLNGGAFQLSNTFSGLAPGPYSIDFTDALGCTGTAATNLVGATPIVGAPLPIMPLCNAGTDGSIIMSASGGVAPYQYSIDAGITYQAVASFTNLAAGSYTIRIKDFNGCFIDVPVVLTEPSLLTMSASGLPSTCNGTDGTITITAAGGTPSYLYSIDNGASYVGSNIFAVAPGLYNNILVKDNNGCTQTTSINVMMVDNMYLNAGADTNVCIGSAVTLQPRTNTETSIFTWTPTNTLSNGTIKNPIATPTDTTTYYLDASWGLCSRKDTIIVNVLHKPVAHAGNDTMICFQTTVLLNGTATNTSGPVTYAWTPASMVVNGAVANTIGRPDSTQLFTVTVKDNYGCNFTVSDDKLVIMQPPVPAYAGNDTNAVYGVPHQLFSSGGVSYLWSPASPLNNPFAQNPLATLTNDTYFNVQVTDIAGCIGNDGVFIRVYNGPTYYLPNAFSPNGDGLNDIFRPTPVGIKSTEYFRVYNRYGQLIFETTQWLKGWDGTFMGKKQPVDAYVWMIKGLSRDGKIVEMKGQVLIVQ